MKKIIDILKIVVNGHLVPVILKLIGLLQDFLRFSEKIYDNMRQDTIKKEEKEANEKIEDVCDNGNLEDLLEATEEKGKL